jgi:ABC-type multidrug transport system ATPase subunit
MADSDVVLLDDPLSAVDGNTGQHIFQYAIKDACADAMRGKLRIVALNSHLHLLSQFSRVIVLDAERIVCDGKPGEIVETHGELLRKVTGDALGRGRIFMERPSSERRSSEHSDTDAAVADIGVAAVEGIAEGGVEGTEGSNGDEQTSGTEKKEKMARGTTIFVQAEKRATGGVTWATYLGYFTAVFSDTCAEGSELTLRGGLYLRLPSLAFACLLLRCCS